MFISILMSLALSSTPSRADDVVYWGLKPIPTNSALAPDVVDSIQKTAHVIAAWNPEQNEIMLQYILIQRVRRMGIRDGLTKPTVILIDAASLAQAPAIIAALVPQLERQDPKTAKQILEALDVHGFSRADLARMGIKTDLTSLRNETLDLIHARYGRNSRETDMLPDLKSDWQQNDPTGIGGAIFGPGSYVHALGIDEIPSNKKSSIMGMTNEDLNACYKRCRVTTEHGADMGGKIGAVVGGTIGGVIGSLGGSRGIAKGLIEGITLGGAGGVAIGGAVGWGICSSRVCAGGSDEQKSPPPKQDAPTPPRVDEPAPATPSHDTDNGGSAPAPPTNDSGGSGSGDNCHSGDDSCGDGKVNPDIDPDHAAPSDTGLPKARPNQQFDRAIWQKAKLAPYVLPSSRDEFSKMPGFDRRSTNTLRGRK